MSCAVERTPIQPGERTKITATASDPDNDTLTYTWKASGGQVVGTGANVEFDSTGLAAGNYTVSGHVDDGKGGAADCSASIDVQAPPAPPAASKVNQCDYHAAASARTDNECKRILDDVALRLKNDPKATAVIVGFADPKEPRAAKLAQSRADNAKKFLGEKGIDASRIQTRTGKAEGGAAAANRRIDIILVPEGATY
jgi:outer membrane protein OmpA-like peptidoglycan-associated protein